MLLQKYHFNHWTEKKMFPFKTSQIVWMIEICHQSTSMCIWGARSLIMMCHLPFLPCLIFSSKEGISLSNNHTFIQETLMWHDYYLSHHTHRHIGHSSVPETLWSKPITANEQNQLTTLVECNHIHDVLMSKEFFCWKPCYQPTIWQST